MVTHPSQGATAPAQTVVQHSNGTLRNPQLARLATEVQDLGARIDSAGPAADLALARSYLDLACRAYDRARVDEGWHFAYRTAEVLARTLNDENLIAEARGLAIEVEAPGKFVPWRAKAIRAHAAIAIDPALPLEHRRAELEVGLRVRHQEYENVYRRLAILRRHQAVLLLIGTPALIAVIVLLSADPGWSWMPVASAAMGVVGAAVSAAQRSTRMAGERIPKQLSSSVASLSRIPVGAVAGLLVWLGAAATNDGTVNEFSVLVAAFASGFSERLVTARSSTSADGSPTPAA
ncbi:hypothetical protein ACWFNE_00065 [Cellulomonas sp. NPDC055163]